MATTDSASMPAAPRARQAEPFMWVTFAILGLVLLAAAAAIGGFVEAGNHTHMVVTKDALGIGAHKSQANDWNYAVAGVGSAVSLLLVAGMLALLRAIAVDVRTIASRPS